MYNVGMSIYNTKAKYMNFIRPRWAPPSWLFGPVWTVLYLIIFVSFGSVFYKAYIGGLPFPLIIVLPFVLNLFFNFIFVPIQFGLRNNFLASLDIIFVLVTLKWALSVIYPYMPWVTYVNIPYLVWVGFATVLQFTVTYLNWGRK